jgi:hypothetical protein
MRADQDWCLACGAAVTTEVTGARGWRTPIVIVGGVLAVAAVALIIAFVQLSDNADTPAQAPPATATPAPATGQPTPQPTPAAPATTPTPAPSGQATPAPSGTPAPSPSASTTPAPSTGAVADWPAGKTAYTVILWSATTRKEAETKATQLQGAGAQGVGILHSDDYSSLRSGYYVVFSGQYGTDKEAQTAAQAAQGSAPGAYAKQVKPK